MPKNVRTLSTHDADGTGSVLGPVGPAPSVPGDTSADGVDLSTESVAGEEDPGAALDLIWPAPSE